MCSYALCNGINSQHLLFLRVAWLIHHAHTNRSFISNVLMVSGNKNDFGVLWEHSLLTADKKWDRKFHLLEQMFPIFRDNKIMKLRLNDASFFLYNALFMLILCFRKIQVLQMSSDIFVYFFQEKGKNL